MADYIIVEALAPVPDQAPFYADGDKRPLNPVWRKFFNDLRNRVGGSDGSLIYDNTLPDRTGQGGQFLTNNGIDLDWSFVPNSGLVNSSLTVTAGTGLAGGGLVALGSVITLDNAGVLSITGTTNRLTADVSTGDITLDISALYAGQTSITTLGTITTGTWNGTTIAIANGGTGQTSQTAAFDALAPTTTKGDLIVHNGTDNIREAIGTNNYVLTADSAQASGVKWAPATAVSSVTVTDDTTTNATVYPTWAAGTSGAQAVTVSSTKITFNPSTGLLTSIGFSGSGALLTSIPNGGLVNSSITVTAGTGMSGGGSVSLGGSVTLNNAGVTSIVGTANRVTASASTGAVTLDISASYVGQSSITTLGTITSGVWNGTNIALANGGTNASLVASNGGIIYSTASAMAVLAGTATAGQILRSGSSAAPSWSTATYPATAGTAANVLRSDGTNFLSAALAASDLSNGVTGSGAVVLANTPTLITPVLGAATGTSVNLTSTATASAFIPSGSSVPTNGVYLPAANTVGVAASSTNILNITTAGLGVGVTPTSKLHVSGTSIVANFVSTSGEVYVKLTGPSATGGYIGYGVGSAEVMTFLTNNSERMRIDASGNVGISMTPTYKLDVTGSIRSSTTVGVGAAAPSTSGAGITFPATASPSSNANTLDDYYEYTAASTACTGAITTAVVWKATKVGNQVTLTLPTTTGTASASAFFEYGVALPTSFRPSASLLFTCGVRDNATNQTTPGMIIVNSSGVIRVYVNVAASANFTAGADAGLAQGCGTSISWTI